MEPSAKSTLRAHAFSDLLTRKAVSFTFETAKMALYH